MKPARRWGFPSLLVSTGLHGALLGAGLLSGLQARAARQPELPATPAGSSVEVEATTEPLPALGAEPPVAAENTRDADPAVAAGSASPFRVSRKSHSIPTTRTFPATPARARSAPRATPSTPSTSEPKARADATSNSNAAGAEPPATNAPPPPGLWPVRGVMSLGYAVARALSLSAPEEASWRDFALGHVGEIHVELSVDERHSLHAARLLQRKAGEPAPATVLEELFKRAVLLMQGGQFVVSASHEPGIEQLVIDVAVRAGATAEEADDAVVEKGFSGATPARPGKAYFLYGTGREVVATVTIVRNEQ